MSFLSKWACFFQINLHSGPETKVLLIIKFSLRNFLFLVFYFLYLWSSFTFGCNLQRLRLSHTVCAVFCPWPRAAVLSESRNAGGEACAACFLWSPLEPAVCLTQHAVHCCTDRRHHLKIQKMHVLFLLWLFCSCSTKY